jgi:hypothetical protein
MKGTPIKEVTTQKISKLRRNERKHKLSGISKEGIHFSCRLILTKTKSKDGQKL